MIPRFFSIERTGPGTLSTMARPRGEDALRPELTALISVGVGGLVSMLPPEEATQLGLRYEAVVATDLGLEFLSVPVDDFGVPDDDLADASAWIRSTLGRGVHVVIHCRAGVGRSSMLAGAVLVDEGLDPDAAWFRIEDARGRAVPDTDEQRAWLRRRRTP